MADVLSVAGSGLEAHQTWLDAISENISNANTATATSGNAFQARYVEVAANAGGGVSVVGQKLGSAAGRLTYDPTNALADANGYVRMPDIDLSEEMSNLIVAQRGYQANSGVIQRAQAMYDDALKIGQS